MPALDSFFRSARRGPACRDDDLDDTFTAFFGSDPDGRTVTVLVGYLDAGGIPVVNTGAPSG